MKILYISSEKILIYPDSIRDSFETLGYEVISCSEKYVGDGYNVREIQQIVDEENAHYINVLIENDVKFVFTVNARSLNTKFFKYCESRKVPIYQYSTDSIRWHSKYLEDMHYYTDIFSFEPTDEKIEFRPGRYVKYLPFACDHRIYGPMQNKQYTRDIFFVGNLDRRRCCILEEIAKNANEKGYRMTVYTGMQIKNIDRLKHAFKILSRQVRYTLKYPNLMKILAEEVHIGKDLSKLYNESKICLNIHTGNDIGMHTGPSLRTFEILGCKSFELIDQGHLTGTEYISGQDIVEVNDNEWNQKIDYYLSHENEREKIAENGYRKTCEYHTMDHLVQRILRAIGKDN